MIRSHFLLLSTVGSRGLQDGAISGTTLRRGMDRTGKEREKQKCGKTPVLPNTKDRFRPYLGVLGIRGKLVRWAKYSVSVNFVT